MCKQGEQHVGGGKSDWSVGEEAVQETIVHQMAPQGLLCLLLLRLHKVVQQNFSCCLVFNLLTDTFTTEVTCSASRCTKIKMFDTRAEPPCARLQNSSSPSTLAGRTSNHFRSCQVFISLLGLVLLLLPLTPAHLEYFVFSLAWRRGGHLC